MKKLLIICLLFTSIVADEFSIGDDEYTSSSDKKIDDKTLYPLVGSEIDEFMPTLQALNSDGVNEFMPTIYPEGYTPPTTIEEATDELLDIKIKKPKKKVFVDKKEIEKTQKIKTKIKKDANDVEFFNSLEGIEQKPVNIEK